MKVLQGLVVAFTLACLFVTGCEERTSVSGIDSKFDTQPGEWYNALHVYINEHWTIGSPGATGGSHYSHIKVYGHNYRQPLPASDATFIANHFDMYMGATEVRDAKATLNPSMVWLYESANVPHMRVGWDDFNVGNWMQSSSNTAGYDWNDILLHYKYNVHNGPANNFFHPGWDATQDTDGDGVIEPGEGCYPNPCSPYISAMTEVEGRPQFFPDPVNHPEKIWFEFNVSSSAYRAFLSYQLPLFASTLQPDGYYFDEASFQNAYQDLDSTITYFGGQPENSATFAYKQDKIKLVSDAIHGAFGFPRIELSNMNNGYYMFSYDRAMDLAAVQHYLSNVFLETWMTTSTGSAASATTGIRSLLLDRPYTDLLEYSGAWSGERGPVGVVFNCLDTAGDDRGKLFSLAMFYMVNHQMAFYYYRTHGHDGDNVSTWQWNPWVVYNVGQPIANTYGYTDFLGNSATNRFFVIASTANYQVLGREYLQSNGDHVLVAVKLATSGVEGASGSATSVSLPGCFKRVNGTFNTDPPTFSLGSRITNISLKNNEGVILLEVGCPGGHGDPNG